MGIYFPNRNYLKLFLFVVITLPFLNINNKIHVNHQVPFFLFFFLGGIVKNAYPNRRLSGIDQMLILMLFFFLCFTVASIPLFYQNDFINIIKDVKFIFFGFILYVFVLINGPLKTAQLIDFDFFLKWNFIIAIICFFLMYFFDIHLSLNQDAYFKINEIRYMNYGTYVIPIYTIYILANDIAIKKFNWVYIVVPLLISGNRTLTLLLFFVSVIIVLKRLSAKKLLVLLVSFVSSFFFVGLVVSKASLESPLYRIKKLLSMDYLVSSISTRLSPFSIALESFESYNYIFGKGLGFTYYIPWFHYRQGLDNYNIYLDSLIPTLYGKYGAFLILPLILFVLYLKKFSDLKSYYYYLIFFLLLGLTNSFLYQNYFIFILFVMFYFKSCSLAKKSN
tara:strand:- start:10416 stop:11591 length:1176 start_codon:yes stop_codon:yes gene_type:complete